MKPNRHSMPICRPDSLNLLDSNIAVISQNFSGLVVSAFMNTLAMVRPVHEFPSGQVLDLYGLVLGWCLGLLAVVLALFLWLSSSLWQQLRFLPGWSLCN